MSFLVIVAILKAKYKIWAAAVLFFHILPTYRPN